MRHLSTAILQKIDAQLADAAKVAVDIDTDATATSQREMIALAARRVLADVQTQLLDLLLCRANSCSEDVW